MRRLSLLLALVLSFAAPIGAPAFQAAKPEEVGLSRERLARIGPALTRQIEDTGFWVDPNEQLVAVLMTQAQPGPWQREFKELFRQMVYQAIVD